MTTTISVSANGQVGLPAEFLRRKKIKPGTALRVTEVGEELYVTRIPEPNEKELRAVMAAAGSLTQRESRAVASLDRKESEGLRTRSDGQAAKSRPR